MQPQFLSLLSVSHNNTSYLWSNNFIENHRDLVIFNHFLIRCARVWLPQTQIIASSVPIITTKMWRMIWKWTQTISMNYHHSKLSIHNSIENIALQKSHVLKTKIAVLKSKLKFLMFCCFTSRHSALQWYYHVSLDIHSAYDRLWCINIGTRH